MSKCLKYIYESSNITFFEQIELDKILREYDLNIIKVEKVRSVYKIDTFNGSYCLKKIGNGQKRAIKSINIMEYLRMNGFYKVTKPIYCISGDIVIQRKNSTYYLTNWINANEVDFNELEQVSDSICLLAEFHEKAKGFFSKNITIKNNIGKLPRLYNDYLKLLNKLKENLENRPDKSIFDSIYYENIDYFINQAEQALYILKKSDYNKLCDVRKKELYLCHDSFYYQNILKDDKSNYFIIDLESCLYDLPVVDIGKFMRRIMYRKNYLWNFDLFKMIISKYAAIKEINENEYKILLSMLMFPYKFYKLGKKKYIKKKKWKDERFLKKLNNVLVAEESKKLFIKNYMDYYGQ
ncbi:CotS family spore coat protein [Lutispora thermophila]|uniref:Spore coat protein, CotS family n=1 Tax=Lutispora thermophila DSM 19022 TaxID=1122184 RepID=A0A1M6F893_9FIRM|nr:CotS family spore coat protein [Lutispora thermophila]SHI93974.1 spore coat protein, CotS family [Lutispora thermophila DSM 19022]